MISVVVVDDQALLRLGIRTLIEVETDLELAGEAEDGVAGLELIEALAPDVVLLDVRMPRMDGLEVLRRVQPPTRVIILTTFELDEYVFEALRAGASGFLTKDADPADILRAIRVVAAGDSLLSPAVTRRVIERFGRASASGPGLKPHRGLHLLTERELEIMGWVATGLSNDEIAATLLVSPATVRTHVSRALIKLGARDRAQLVVIAYQSGLHLPA
jgi:DNA-binding NarL/FixJ family response regulator